MTKVLNFGSLNHDHVYRVPHFVRAGETLATLSRAIYAGGKGLNQSIALAKAGADVSHAGCAAQDGHTLTDWMASCGVHVDQMDYSADETGHTIIQVNDEGQNSILLHHGGNFQITEAYMDRVLAQYQEGDVLVLQNEINDIAILIEKAAARGMRIALNPSPFESCILSFPLDHVTWLLLNEIEGNQMTGKTEPNDILDVLLKQYPNMRVVLTLGEAGVCYRDAANQYQQGIYAVNAVDTTAAGDTFTGFFLAELLREASIPQALSIAAKAAAVAISRAGASPSIPTLQEVQESTLSLKP